MEVLLGTLKLAVEWGKVEKLLPKVAMLSGANHRERVLSTDESYSLRDVTTILLDCARRPEECFGSAGKTSARPQDSDDAARLDMRDTRTPN